MRAGILNFIMGLWVVLLVPQQLSRAGLSFEGAACALLLLMAGGTLAAGWLFRVPVVAAPSAAITGFLCYAIVLSQGFTCPEMLGAVTVAGLICVLLYAGGAYTRLENSLPDALKQAIGVALGLWLLTLGLKQSGLLIGVPQGVMGPGDMLAPVTFYSLVGIVAGAAILANGHRAGIIIGMLVTVIAAFIDGYIAPPRELFMPPMGLDRVVLQADVLSCWKLAGAVVAIVLTNLCAALALGNSIYRAAMADEVNTSDKVNTPYGASTSKLFCFNGLLTAVGGLLGCGQAMVSPLSVAGIAADNKALSSVVTAIIFLLLIPCLPLIKELALEPCVTGPAAALAGIWYTLQALQNMQTCVSKENKGNKDHKDNKAGIKDIFQEKPLAISALLMVVLVPLWGNIVYGIGAGIVSYTLLSLVVGRYWDIPPILWAISLIFIYSFGIAI